MSPATNNDADNKNGLLLYLHNYSFYVQKVLMALHEKKLTYRTQVLDISRGEQYQPWFLDINPRGEVPVLKDGVKVIPDSARIIDYLEDNFSNGDTPRLIPLDQGGDIRQRVAYFRELINKIPANVVTVGSFYHPDLTRKPKLPFIAPVRAAMKAADAKLSDKLRDLAEQNPQAKEALLQKAEVHDKTHALVTNRESYLKLLDQVDSTLIEVEEELSSHKDEDSWLVTESFTVADIDLAVLLERLCLIGLKERFWQGRPHLNRYYARVRTRDSFRRTMPGPLFHATALIGGKTLAVGAAAVIATIAGAIYFSRKSD